MWVSQWAIPATIFGTATNTTITTATVGLTGTPCFVHSSVGDDVFNGTAFGGPTTPGDIFALTAMSAIGTTDADIIDSFDINKDTLQLSLGTFANTEAVLAPTNDSGADMVITLCGPSTVTLVGIHKADLTSAHFLLANG